MHETTKSIVFYFPYQVPIRKPNYKKLLKMLCVTCKFRIFMLGALVCIIDKIILKLTKIIYLLLNSMFCQELKTTHVCKDAKESIITPKCNCYA